MDHVVARVYRALQTRLDKSNAMDFESKKIWRYGDDVDTDVIIPARYFAIADWNELAEHAMEDIDITLDEIISA